MMQQTTIPRTPEEVAMCLRELSEKGQYVVTGFIAGMRERERLSGTARPPAERPGA